MTEPTIAQDPTKYDGQLLCIRCGNGYPCCADRRPDGTRYSHVETCQQYQWADDLCEPCASLYPEETR